MEKTYYDLMPVLKSELVMALGCTEPGATAYGAAAAAYCLDGKLKKLRVLVSAAIYKNGAATFIPSTGKRGLCVAAALGAAVAEPDKELMILNDIGKDHLKIMNGLLDAGAVTVEPAGDEKAPVYVEAWAEDDLGNVGHSVIRGSHNKLVLVEKNGVVQKRLDEEATAESGILDSISIDDILSFVENVSLDELEFIKESVKLNWDIAQYGINNDNGLSIGKTMKKIIETGLCSEDLINYACMMTTAAVDVRMGGHTLPAMACGGSGNQGILASVPIIAAAKKCATGEEKLLRSLTFSYLVTIYTKEYLGKLSVLCGCSTTAGVGCAAGLTLLMGGDRNQIRGSIHNLLAGLSGMICDGAKEGCSFKIMNAVLGIMQSSLLALQGVCVSRDNGIIGVTESETIINLKSLSQQGMANADTVIIGILKEKLMRSV